MRAIEQFTEQAREVIMRLKASDVRNADALLLTEQGVYPVRGLLPLLNSPDYVATAIHCADLPDPLYSDVVFLRPFMDVADAIRAPFGADTVYAIKSRISNGAKWSRSGV